VQCQILLKTQFLFYVYQLCVFRHTFEQIFQKLFVEIITENQKENSSKPLRKPSYVGNNTRYPIKLNIYHQHFLAHAVWKIEVHIAHHEIIIVLFF